MSVKITANTADALNALTKLKQGIMWAIPGAINNSTRQIRDTIYNDYRRFGHSSPSHLNPSRSGKGFTDRSGRLRASIRQDIDIGSTKVVGSVEATMSYAQYVELLWNGKYAYLVPALVQNYNYIQQQVEEAVIRAVMRLTK
jgi:hypothetical protein